LLRGSARAWHTISARVIKSSLHHAGMLFVSGPLLKLDANIEIGRRDRAYAGNQSELLLVVCRWNVHILLPTKALSRRFRFIRMGK